MRTTLLLIVLSAFAVTACGAADTPTRSSTETASATASDFPSTCSDGLVRESVFDYGFTKSGGKSSLNAVGGAALDQPFTKSAEATDFRVVTSSDESAEIELLSADGAVVGELVADKVDDQWFLASARTC